MINRVLLFVALCACAVSSYKITRNTPSLDSFGDAKALFEKFIVDYKRQYVDEDEKQMRFEMFKETLNTIEILNERQGGRKVFGINEFSDYTYGEKRFTNKLGLMSNVSCKLITDADITYHDAPPSMDWRDRNAVTPVKDQGLCSADYAFATIGHLEGQYAIKHNKSQSFSVQRLVDCSNVDGNDGCCYGNVISAFEYIQEQGGIETESDYPYRHTVTRCKRDPSKYAVKITDCAIYNLTSQEKLKQLVSKVGPIPIFLDATTIRSYSKHVVKDCHADTLNLAALLVGYGTDPVDGDYWIVKNSWGSNWGINGYFYIERGEGKKSCGLLNIGMVSADIA